LSLRRLWARGDVRLCYCGACSQNAWRVSPYKLPLKMVSGQQFAWQMLKVLQHTRLQVESGWEADNNRHMVLLLRLSVRTYNHMRGCSYVNLNIHLSSQLKL
jgi:hypothetical protein